MSVRLRPSNMARVVAVCGMPGSGKGEFASVLSENNIPVLSMGDMVRAEVKRLELEESPGIFGEIAAQLRAQYGEDVLAVRLSDAVDSHLESHPIVLIEGMRGTAERVIFEQRWGEQFYSLAVVASPDTRFSRIQNRGRSEDGDRQAFEVRDTRERGWGLEQIIAESDFIIDNNVELPLFRDSCLAWLESFKN
ncbi:MAG: AAA family ATPase [Euryarchaeota archaeon]|jgi:dephospho-CoA kinase|nr:AAA family ATPase [Euryarchaeota archaeon]MBT5595301.1 AAA family ATPase [Euryarchaeota archaeon]MBT5844350.1 AAA family ATPase [Euryarchaeota archaeon]MBT6640024.1 AAA family ATPase [Euryarchaeota archaeon]MBT6844928.1 AAA family ATPase [Euryarchaeota archaeon]